LINGEFFDKITNILLSK